MSSAMNDADHFDDNDLNDPDLLRQLKELSSLTGKSEPAKRIIPSQAEVHNIDLDAYAALAQGNDDVHVEFGEADYNDPNLLKELASLSGQDIQDGMENEKLQIDVEDNTIPAAKQEDISIKDAMDPPHPPKSSESISQLMSIGFSQKQSLEALALFDNDTERATNYLLDRPPAVPEHNSAKDILGISEKVHASNPTPMDATHEVAHNVSLMDYIPESTIENMDTWQENPKELKTRAMAYQREALAVKKQGDKKKAIALLRQSKVLMQQYNDFMQTDTDTGVDETSKSMELIDDPPTADISSSTPVTKVMGDETNSKTEPVASDMEKTRQLLDLVIQRQKAYKQAALHYKNIGNLAVAKDMVRKSKELLRTGIQIKQGEILLDAVEIMPEPDMTLGDGRLRHISPIIGPANHTYGQLETQLMYQIDVCHNLSVQSNGNRMQRQTKTMSDSSSRDQFVRLEQAYTADLVSLRSHGDQGTNASIPALHYEQVDYTYKNILDHIPANQMQLKIIRATGLQTLHLATVDPYVAFDFCGWPPENTAQAAQGKGETSIQKGNEPVFDFSTQIPIARTNRIFTRYIQRKKLVMEVFHNKYTYGLFRRPISIGKVSIPLDTLLTKTSIAGTFDLLDSSRKKTGGKLEIQINLREPLTAEDVAKRSERWLVIDGFNSDVSQLLSLAGLTSTPYQPIQSTTTTTTTTTTTPPPPPSTTQAESQPVPASPAPAKMPSTEATEVSETSIELEEAEEEFNSVDNLVSNMVLDHEINLVTAMLQKGGANDELADRKQALDIKMNMLIVQVQTGMLDMDRYLQMVQKRMDRDRQLALLFKKHGRMDLAKAALIRKKIMQDELDEAKAAMAEAGEEE
ncbi:hypothetical protein DFQ30_007390 [Apophysomyces sp. BC1015]|nr:hypothetical protein DFQ30_007390 [Apophysomyces sp. BC1015]KAG0182737.1 hypothetical protein DFQ29_002372 [Apophysomyces sp. BC1021]